MYKQDLILNNLQWLICPTTQSTNQPTMCVCFQPFFVQAFKNCHRLLKVQYVIAIHLMR